jgi:lipopolysaccharide/colanic/teichoic acid biosynthesis glycosyltransferase
MVTQTHSTGYSAERVADCIAAVALLVFVIPLMVLVALAIKCDSQGPIFVRRKRVAAGRPYIALRFRSTPDGHGFGHPTRVGWFLQYTQIENLPQLVNVLRGEMSCTKSRPGCPFFLD